jgi:hypothetical protein
VLVIDRWLPRLTLDDDGLFDARDVNPALPEAVAHSLLVDLEIVARMIRRATPAEIMDRSRHPPLDSSILVLPARRFRDRPRLALLAWRIRRNTRRASQADHPLRS